MTVDVAVFVIVEVGVVVIVAPGGVPVIAGTGAPSTRDAVTFTAAASAQALVGACSPQAASSPEDHGSYEEHQDDQQDGRENEHSP